MANNNAKLREALKAAKQYLDGYTVNIFELRKKVDEALAEPVRNCDVGTAEEQNDRFSHFCTAHSAEYDIDGEDCSRKCPLYTSSSCRLTWAQLPYESEEAK